MAGGVVSTARLRAARPDDAAAIAAIYAPHVLGGTVSFEVEAPDPAEMGRRMAASAGLYPWIVAADGGDAVLGYAYADRFSAREAYRWSVETTVYVADAAHRRGVGRRLYGALLATLTAQGFAQAIARIALPNPASIRLHEALGFRHTGDLRAIGWKREAWIDVGYWQCPLPAVTASPAEPGRFVELGIAGD